MLNGSFRGEVWSLYITSPLQLHHIATVAYNHLTCIQALQNSLQDTLNYYQNEVLQKRIMLFYTMH